MRLSLFALSVVLLAGLATPAHAKLEVCNKTPSPFVVAIAFETDADIVSQGWWTVDPGKCETVVSGDLTRQYYYHYVKSTALNVEWAGTFNFCTTEDPQFRISGASSCEDRKFHSTGFRQTDVGSSKDFALDISMGPSPEPEQTAAPVEAAPATETTATPAEAAPVAAPDATTQAPPATEAAPAQ